MAQNTILAAGTSITNSTDVVVTTTPVSVGLFLDNGDTLSQDAKLAILMDTPEDDAVVGYLTRAQPAVQLSAPGTYRVQRTSTFGVSVGVFSET